MAILIIWAPSSLASLHMAIPLFAARCSWETSSLACPALVAQLLWHLSGLSPVSGGCRSHCGLTTHVSLLEIVMLCLVPS